MFQATARAVLVSLLGALPVTALAQEAKVSPQAMAYINGAENRNAVDAAFRTEAAALAASCSIDLAKARRGVRLYVPLEFSPDGKAPTKGAWREELLIDLCGKQRQLNVLALVQSPAGVKRSMLLPGTSIGDPLLQRDGVLYAQAGAASKAPSGCQKFSVLDTSFTSFDAPTAVGKKAWRELWTLDACGREVAVEMSFIPDATGTTITAHAK